jgi:hypothetical protein
MSTQKKSWSELTKEERDEIFKKLNCEVKVKLLNGRIFEFNPFKECASLPPQYNLSWLPLYDNEKPKRQFMFCDEVFRMVATEGIESDNIDYLNETKFDTKNMKLNVNIEDDHIWTLIQSLAHKYKRDLNDIDDEYKQQLIKGYKICKGKTYNFKSVEEEEQYFMRSDVTPEH